MARATTTTTTSTSKAAALATVQVQTLPGNQGTQAALATVQAAVAQYNKANGKAAAHTVVPHLALANNTKGMQWQLALLATLARMHGAAMVRLSVHGGAVALCGTPAAIAATQAAVQPYTAAYGTLVANAYNQGQHGNHVGFTNGYLCGCPAGLQLAAAVTATLAYGVGYLFTFAAPGNASAYAMGTAAAKAAGKLAAPKAPKAAAPKAPKAPKAAATAPATAAATAPATAAPVATSGTSTAA